MDIPSKGNVMIDVETLSTGHYPLILSIGACTFDQYGPDLSNTFYERIDPESGHKLGLQMDPPTVMWWMKQSEEARNELFKNQIHLWEALTKLRSWFNQYRRNLGENGEQILVWGNGANADGPWMRDAYKKTYINCPWTYQDERCFRTLYRAHGQKFEKEKGMTDHKALDDALEQAKIMTIILNHYKLWE